jgi:antitoxin CptB
MSDLDRIRWHCRRGLLELDLVLTAFLQEGYAQLGTAEKATFVRMLDADDNDLWDWISARQDPPEPAMSTVIERLRAVRPGREAA